MKNFVKVLFVVLSLVSVLMVVGCKTDEKADEKVIAEKYRGEYRPQQQPHALFAIYLEKDSFTETQSYDGRNSNTKAYTIGNDLYAKDYLGEGYIYGTFEDDNTLILHSYGTFIREVSN